MSTRLYIRLVSVGKKKALSSSVLNHTFSPTHVLTTLNPSQFTAIEQTWLDDKVIIPTDSSPGIYIDITPVTDAEVGETKLLRLDLGVQKTIQDSIPVEHTLEVQKHIEAFFGLGEPGAAEPSPAYVKQ